jgi:hypothetical protein
MAKSEMIFICHGGSKLNHKGTIGILWDNHALVVATKETGDCETGYRALWEATGNTEEFFDELRWRELDKPGIWYLSVEFDEDSVEGGDWEHIADGHPVYVDKPDILQDVIRDTANATKNSTIYNKWRWL